MLLEYLKSSIVFIVTPDGIGKLTDLIWIASITFVFKYDSMNPYLIDWIFIDIDQYVNVFLFDLFVNLLFI